MTAKNNHVTRPLKHYSVRIPGRLPVMAIFNSVSIVRASVLVLVCGLMTTTGSWLFAGSTAGYFGGGFESGPTLNADVDRLPRRHVPGVYPISPPVPITFPVQPSVDSTLYVVDSYSRLGTINLSTFEVDVVGVMDVNLNDIAFRADGKLFGVGPSGLYEVDPETAATTRIGGRRPRGRGFDGSGMNALVFSTDGTMYAAGRDSTLYTIDPDTGSASAVGPIGFDSAGDLVFDESGQLFMSSTEDMLVKIDPSTGAGTEIGAFGFPQVLGLARDQDNVTYGYSMSNIFTIDLATGQGTQLFNYQGNGLSQAFGGSFWGEAVMCDTPEPGSLVLAAMASLLSLFSGGRRRRNRCIALES